MRRFTTQWSERGDTIVEVLIAIAIVSSVLAGAFTVTQKSTTAVRDGQERSEMLQLLQGQVELVRASALTGASSSVYKTSPKYFCMDSSGSRKSYPATVTASPYPTSNATAYPTACKSLNSAGVNLPSEGLYNIAVSYNDVSHVFIFYGYWEKNGTGLNTMQLSYRIEP